MTAAREDMEEGVMNDCRHGAWGLVIRLACGIAILVSVGPLLAQTEPTKDEGDKPVPVSLEEVKTALAQFPNVQAKKVGPRVLLEGTVSFPEDLAKLDVLTGGFGGTILSFVTLRESEEINRLKAEDLKKRLQSEVLKIEELTVSVRNGRAIIGGRVYNAGDRARAEAIAQVDFQGNVVNNIEIWQRPIEIDVVFASIQLSKAKEIGFDMFSNPVPIGAGVGWSDSSSQTVSRTDTLIPQQREISPAAAGVPAVIQTDPIHNRTVGDSTSSALSWNASASAGGTLRFLVAQGAAEILTKPHLTTLNGEEATIQQGGDRGYRVAGTGSSNVVFKEFGIILHVKPEIESNGLIRTGVTLEFSFPVQTAPDLLDFEKFQTKSTVIVAEGQTIVVSGLVHRKDQPGVVKVPLLGDIPGLDFIFSKKTNNVEDRELVVLLTPTVPTVVNEMFSEGSRAFGRVLRRVNPEPLADPEPNAPDGQAQDQPQAK